MGIQDLRKLLEETDNKLAIFTNFDVLSKYSFRINELFDLIKDFLSDEEKVKLLDLSIYKSYGVDRIVELISDENILVQLLDNDNIIMESGDIVFDILSKKLSDDTKKELLYNPKFQEQCYILDNFIFSLSEETKIEILNNLDLVRNKLHFSDKQISSFISSLSTDDEKRSLLNLYQFVDSLVYDVIRTYSNVGKLQTIIEENMLTLSDKIMLLISLDIETLTIFFRDNKKFLSQNRIRPYEIVAILDSDKQIEFVRKMNDMNFTIDECKEIVVSLSTPTRQKIDKMEILEEYQMANDINDFSDNVRMRILSHDIISDFLKEYQIIDILNNLTNSKKQSILAEKEIISIDDFYLTDDQIKDIISSLDIEAQRNIMMNRKMPINKLELLERYQGIGRNLIISPELFNEEERQKFMHLCHIHPELQVANISFHYSTVYFYSTASEYIEAENWINSIIDSINPKYSKAQKMAIIDNAIGKKVSYSPDSHTEISKDEDSRALWKIVCSGYGVCEGIAVLEHYMFSRVGIESELVSSTNHMFLKMKNFEFLLANGEMIKGTTILDPTWNLSAHKFGGKPDNFCISYEEAQKHDIDANGKNHYCHQNYGELLDATFTLDEQNLRQLFTSVGLADENGIFPIAQLFEKSRLLHEQYANQPALNIEKQFQLLSEYYPEFATCQNCTMNILANHLLNNNNLKFDRCIVNRVYEINDKEKKPVLFIYIKSEELGEKFYYINKIGRKFVQMQQDEFTKNFECYKQDLIRNNGFRPWEVTEQKNIDLSNSSGKIIEKEGKEI